MANSVKFLFDTEFATAAVAGEPETKLLTGNEIQQLRDSAFAAGVNEGVARENRATEHRQSEALAAIASRIGAIGESQGQAMNHIIDEATNLAMAMARKISPALAQHHPLVGIEAMIRDFLHQLLDEPHIVVRVPEILIDDLKRRIDSITAGCGFAGRVVLMPDPVLKGNDCRLEWADGGAVRNIDSILNDIETGVVRLLHNTTDLSHASPGELPGDGPDQLAGASR